MEQIVSVFKPFTPAEEDFEEFRRVFRVNMDNLYANQKFNLTFA